MSDFFLSASGAFEICLYPYYLYPDPYPYPYLYPYPYPYPYPYLYPYPSRVEGETSKETLVVLVEYETIPLYPQTEISSLFYEHGVRVPNNHLLVNVMVGDGLK